MKDPLKFIAFIFTFIALFYIFEGNLFAEALCWNVVAVCFWLRETIKACKAFRQ